MEFKDDQNKLRLRVDLIKRRNFWYWLKEHSSIFVAIGTILLAGATFWHIMEARSMRRATKEIADLGIKEFKMRAFPSFQFVTEKQKIYIDSESGKLRQSFKVLNRGEITAHNVLFLTINLYEKENGSLHLHTIVNAYYEGKELMTSANYEVKIFQNGAKTIWSGSKFPANHSLDTLKYALVYIKFKVPYGEGYEFETYGFIKKPHPDKSNLDTYVWMELDVHTSNDLIKKYLESVKNNRGQDEWLKITRKFLEDYPGYENFWQ